MPYLKWDKSLHIGLLELDEQHKILFNIANDLIAAIDNGDGEAALKNTFDRLKTYTENHFSAEEAYMKKIGYPDLDSHSSEHALLLIRTNTLRKMLKDGHSLSAQGASRFVTEWIVDHIMESDKKIGTFAKG